MALIDLTSISDGDLVSQLSAICLEGHRLTGKLLVHLIEVEERRLDLRAACTSMFDFCVRRLGMSEGAAFRRITGARLVRRFPQLLPFIERGELHLSTLVLLRPHLTEQNIDERIAAARGKTHREVEELLARLAPGADVPDVVRELPPTEPLLSLPLQRTAAMPSPSRIEPLAEARFVVQLTASVALRDKLERARDLMSHRNPDRDLAVVVEAALDCLIENLEKERLGKAQRPPRSPRPTTTTRVPRAVRREVFARDGQQCTFHDEEGRRCPSRALLELDHVTSRALGGASDASNLRVLCRAHNRLHAEDVFGRAHVAAEIDARRRSSKTLDLALRGLTNLGFTKSDAQRVLDDLARHHGKDLAMLSVETLLAEAIAALT